MDCENCGQPANRDNEETGVGGASPVISTTAPDRVSAARLVTDVTALKADGAVAALPAAQPAVALRGEAPASPLRHFYLPAVPIRHVEGVLLEQLEIYHHKIQRAIDRIPDEAALTQQLVGDVWRGRVFVMGFFRAVEYILAASRPEWSFFDTRARLHYRVHDARWEADRAAHDAIELIVARRHQQD